MGTRARWLQFRTNQYILLLHNRRVNKEPSGAIPLRAAYRLVRMFSFWGDTVLDPFCGTGTTMLAAMKCGRNSIGIEIVEDYCRMALKRLNAENQDLFRKDVIIYDNVDGNGDQPVVKEKGATYKPRKKVARSKKVGTK